MYDPLKATSPHTKPSKVPGEPGKNDIRRITDALKGLRFGSVEVIIQDARIIQIQRLEKKRLV
jgi:hypothetical protein